MLPEVFLLSFSLLLKSEQYQMPIRPGMRAEENYKNPSYQIHVCQVLFWTAQSVSQAQNTARILPKLKAKRIQ